MGMTAPRSMAAPMAQEEGLSSQRNDHGNDQVSPDVARHPWHQWLLWDRAVPNPDSRQDCVTSLPLRKVSLTPGVMPPQSGGLPPTPGEFDSTTTTAARTRKRGDREVEVTVKNGTPQKRRQRGSQAVIPAHPERAGRQRTPVPNPIKHGYARISNSED